MADTDRGARRAVQIAALLFGIVFLLVGVAGFVPGLTSGMGSLMLMGHDSGALLLGVFQVSVLHNVVHLLFGVAGIVLSRTASRAAGYLVWGGAVYAVVWLYGLAVVGGSSPANIVPVNSADNWLHLALAVVMIALGVLLARSVRVAVRPTPGDRR
jgi:hypothetical protein